ncbi:hypothetical protein HanIR_Chr05g0240871 [Helianthus annuus]|nr:hypothetical protein HanIR_Chr05g0240871 [Helianthus annuus]
MWKDLSHVPSTSQATFLRDSQAVSVRSGQAVTADIRAVSVNYLCRFSWLQAVLAGAKPLQKVRAVSTHCSSRFSWLKPFQTFIFSEWPLKIFPYIFCICFFNRFV